MDAGEVLALDKGTAFRDKSKDSDDLLGDMTPKHNIDRFVT